MTIPLPLPLEPESPDIRAALRERLLALPFAVFLRCAADLLERLGYADVSLSSRKDWRGRNGKDGSGGFDLAARITAHGVSRRILVQAKQFDESQRVYLAQVDALRGVCLRAGATEALLLTTGRISPRVPRERLAASSLAPVRLLDGEELLDLLITHRLGVWEEAGEDGEARYGLDAGYFKGLEAGPEGNSRADFVPVPEEKIDPPVASRFLVTVALAPAAPTANATPRVARRARAL